MMPRWGGWICCGLGMALAGSVVVASKLAAAGLPTFVAAASRYGLAALVLAPWALCRHGVPRLCRHDRAVLLGQAAAGSLGFSALLLLGLRHTGGADAAVITGTLPAMVGLLSVAVLRERVGAMTWASIALASLGAASLGLGGSAAAPAGLTERLIGDGLVLAAVAGEAIFVLLDKRLRRPLPPLTVSAAMCLLGLLLTAPVAMVELATGGLGVFSASAWCAVLWHALVPTVAGFLLWYAGTTRLGGAEAAVFTAIMPVAAILLSAAVLGERLEERHGVATALVVAAMATALSRRRRTTPP